MSRTRWIYVFESLESKRNYDRAEYILGFVGLRCR